MKHQRSVDEAILQAARRVRHHRGSSSTDSLCCGDSVSQPHGGGDAIAEEVIRWAEIHMSHKQWRLLSLLHSASLEFLLPAMLNRIDECHRFIVYRDCGVAPVSDQCLCVQPAKLESRSVMAIDRRGTHRPFNIHG